MSNGVNRNSYEHDCRLGVDDRWKGSESRHLPLVDAQDCRAMNHVAVHACQRDAAASREELSA
eukprot:4442207-Pleurochrysis_carterae.AAC.1